MARMSVFLVLALALTAGGVLAFGTYSYVRGSARETVTMPTKSVVVAASDMNMGDEIEQSDVRIIDWPANAVPQNAISDPNEVIGRGLLLPVIQNEPFLPMKLASKEAGSRAAAGDSAGAARRVGARQRGHRRRRLRAARDARGCRRDGEPHAAAEAT